MPPSTAPAHYSFTIEELRSLAKSAEADPAIGFILRIRALTTISDDIENSADSSRTEILIPNDATSDIAVFDQILNTEACDIYFDHVHVPSRSAIFPRLRRIVNLYENIRHNRNHFSTHRRAANRHLSRRLDKLLDNARRMIRNTAHDVAEWHSLHIAKDRWRRALITRAPSIERYILHFDPPTDLTICILQTEILEGTALRMVSNAYLMHKLSLGWNSWEGALCRLIPYLTQYIAHFQPPLDEATREIQTGMLLKALYSVSDTPLV